MVQHTNLKLFAGIASFLTLSIPTVTLAAYIPPDDQVPPQTRGGTAGRRTAAVSFPFQNLASLTPIASLTPLAPLLYLGQTTAVRPTFSWVVNGSESLPLEFTLYEHEPSTNSLVLKYKTTLKSSSGMMSFSIPKDSLELSTGKIYVWQVVAKGNGSPSQNAWLRSPIKVVEMPEALMQSLAKTNDPVKRINLYAESGFWYDALALTLDTSKPAIKQTQLDLLEKLASVEKLREGKDLIPEYRFSYTLKQFIAAQQKRETLK